jgi:hypothetical protein
MSNPILINEKFKQEIDRAVESFINLYNERVDFFKDDFIEKVKSGNKKALSKLAQFKIPPTQMDLREGFAKCVSAKVPHEYEFLMKDGRKYTKLQLIELVPRWALIAEEALIKSDPVLADKLMSLKQWNAKSAFEVMYATANNELRALKTADANNRSSLEHHIKWTINPLKKAIEEAIALQVPGNSLIGYGDRSPLSVALERAKKFEAEFYKFYGK